MIEQSEISAFVFSSENITNIWAGYGARTWAVSISSHEPTNKGTRNKASSINIGDFGILYCKPWKSFTVPFIFQSKPDITRIEKDIWHEEWMIPFSFVPLGSPRKRMAGSDVLDLAGAKRKGITNYSNYLYVQGNFAFQPSKIASEDWQQMLARLCES